LLVLLSFHLSLVLFAFGLGIVDHLVTHFLSLQYFLLQHFFLLTLTSKVLTILFDDLLIHFDPFSLALTFQFQPILNLLI
jgi:hypothetical protein